MSHTQQNGAIRKRPHWVVMGAFILLAVGSLAYLAYQQHSTDPVSETREAVGQFLNSVQQRDRVHLRDRFGTKLKSRLTPTAILDWFDSEEILPLNDWQILNTHTFKGKGVTHIQTGKALLRFDFSTQGGWQLNEFCRVDRAVQAEALKFMHRMRSGNISAAHKQTVDAFYPNRQRHNFPPERLYQIHRELKDLAPVKVGEFSLRDYYDYHQTFSTGAKTWSLSLHHLDNYKSGCRFFIFDINQ